MAVGRFRVKANVDLAVARRLVTELEGLGALCSVVDAAGAATPTPTPASAPSPAPAPAPAPAPKSAPASGLAHAGAAPASKSAPASGLAHAGAAAAPKSAPAPAADRSGDQYQSGLAAAFGAPSDSGADIGALAVDSGSFALATLDGDEGAPAAQEKTDAPVAAGPMDDDLFAPPEMSAEKELALAVDESALPRKTPPPMAAQPDPDGAPPSMLEQLAEMQQDTPPPMPAVAPRSATASAAAPATAPAAPTESLPVRARKLLGQKPHLRLAAGLLLGILLGFVPAHLFASFRERSAYDAARADVRDATHEYVSAITQEEVDRLGQNLEQVRRDAKSRMESTQSSIALMSLIIWAGCGLGVGFYWFRKIDWD